MKIRADFVTNSSSSSYIVLYEVLDRTGVEQWILEEYGKRGLSEFRDNVFKPKDIEEEDLYHDYYGPLDKLIDEGIVEPEKEYFKARFIEWTDDPDDKEGLDAILAENIPGKFLKEIWESPHE